MKHIVAGVATILAIWAFYFMATLDSEANRVANISTMINKSSKEDKKLAKNENSAITKVQEPVEDSSKKEDKEIAKKLQALKDKAGNLMAFKVSPLYKTKCSSCHGVNGGGIIGPKLVGLSKDKVLQALRDFKSGKRKNYVMYGLLSKMQDEDLVKLSNEIATFKEKLKESNK